MKEILEKNMFFCVLTREPNVIWLDFLMLFYGCYKVFVVIDNCRDYSNLKIKYPEITFVQVSDKECREHKYFNSDYILKKIVATDRAFYYFNKIETNYDFIWFCEDDVFFRSEETILNIDNKFTTAQLIVHDIKLNKNGQKDGWKHWSNVNKSLNLPWARCLLCLARASRKLMIHIDDFVQQQKKLIYKEILFPTLAIQNKLEIQTPYEMSKIKWNKEWRIQDIITQSSLLAYHPVKNLETHVEIRESKFHI